MNSEKEAPQTDVSLRPTIAIRMFCGIIMLGMPSLIYLTFRSSFLNLDEPLMGSRLLDGLMGIAVLLIGYVCVQCFLLKFKTSGDNYIYRGFSGFIKNGSKSDLKGYTVDRGQGNQQIHLFDRRGKAVAFLSPIWFANFGSALPWLEGLDELTLQEAARPISNSSAK